MSRNIAAGETKIHQQVNHRRDEVKDLQKVRQFAKAKDVTKQIKVAGRHAPNKPSQLRSVIVIQTTKYIKKEQGRGDVCLFFLYY